MSLSMASKNDSATCFSTCSSPGVLHSKTPLSPTPLLSRTQLDDGRKHQGNGHNDTDARREGEGGGGDAREPLSTSEIRCGSTNWTEQQTTRGRCSSPLTCANFSTHCVVPIVFWSLIQFSLNFCGSHSHQTLC